MVNHRNNINKNEPCFSIGTFANILEITQKTLRTYDVENILKPRRTPTNRRMYTMSDYNKAQFILFLTKNLALNLSGVKIILTFFKKYKIAEDKYLSSIKQIAKEAEMSDLIQNENIYKTSKRGRKKKKEN